MTSKLRDAFLALHPPALDVVLEVAGVKVKVRQPTVAQRDKIMLRATVDGQIHPGALAVHAAIACTVDPETGAPLFVDADAVALINLPTGSWVEELGTAAVNLIRQAEAAGKASREKTEPAADSSSPSPKS